MIIGVNVNGCIYFGRIVLYVVVCKDCIYIVNMLLDVGVSVYIKDVYLKSFVDLVKFL